MIKCELFKELTELTAELGAQQAKEQVLSTDKLILEHSFLVIGLRNRLLKRRRHIDLADIDAACSLRQLIDLALRGELHRRRCNLQPLQ